MLPDRASNPGPLTYESGALPIALRGLATPWLVLDFKSSFYIFLTVPYPCDLYCLKAKSELFGKRHTALFVLEFSIVKQRNG